MVNRVIDNFIPPGSLEEQWNVAQLEEAIATEFAQKFDIQGWLDADDTLHEETLREKILAELENAYDAKEQMAGAETMRHFEKAVMLQVLDQAWKEHLAAMDHLRQGIGLRSYAQKNPKQEYKREAFEMFGAMLERVKHDTISILSRIRIQGEQDLDDEEERKRAAAALRFQHAQASALSNQAPQGQQPATGQPVRTMSGAPAPAAAPRPETFKRDGRKVGRNEPCPCGSGKKFKQCHGKLS